jgi:hypothetical protein
MTHPSIRVRAYRVVVDDTGEVTLQLTDHDADDLDLVDGQLVGPHVEVATRAVLVGVDADGRLFGRAVDPLELRDGALSFDPRRGGMRTRDNRRANGAFNALVWDANAFGMVNAYVHADRCARYTNRLLTELGAPALPTVGVVVGAHFGSRLPGYGEGDGDRRSGELRPLSGGHYRLSRRTTGVPEPYAVSPSGEIHLGPSRYRKPFAGVTSYLRNAAHNPAIIYHEFGHHLCRHTADFRCNADRRPHAQRNGKPGVEEGICDYFAAALLGSGRPYGWYRADRGRRRDVHQLRAAVPGHGDAHAVGAAWASALWHCRESLVDNGLLRSRVDHDRVLIGTLLRIGEVGRGGKRRARVQRAAQRMDPSTVLASYADALTETAGAPAARYAEGVFDEAGLIALPRAETGARASC